jgi:creatinine amidohydrolase
VIVNGHGGNAEALRRAARRLRQAEVGYAAPWNWWSSLDGLETELFGVPSITHADAIETSMVYAVAEDLVRERAIEAAEAGASESWGRSVHGAEVGFDTIDFSESGAVGEPTRGSKEAGERLYERAVSELDALVGWLAEREFEHLLPREHK